jgi:hypothetical protein
LDIPLDALQRLESAVARSRRTLSVRLPETFFRSPSIALPPLAELTVGGQGGVVRLRLYLSLAMLATKHPFIQKRRTYLAYAQMLGIPTDTGPRRIREAFKFLEARNFIRYVDHDGASQIEMLYPDGSGTEWPARYTSRFISIPIELWSQGWIVRFSARALAVYLALTELVAGREEADGSWMPGPRKSQYGMANDTWTRAIKELEGLGVITTTSERYGDDWSEIRVRKLYRLVPDALTATPNWDWTLPTSSKDTKPAAGRARQPRST